MNMMAGAAVRLLRGHFGLHCTFTPGATFAALALTGLLLKTRKNRRHLADMILLATDSGAYDASLNWLKAALKGHFAMKLVYRKDKEITIANQNRSVDWRGEVLLIRQTPAKH